MKNETIDCSSIRIPYDSYRLHRILSLYKSYFYFLDRIE